MRGCSEAFVVVGVFFVRRSLGLLPYQNLDYKSSESSTFFRILIRKQTLFLRK